MARPAPIWSRIEVTAASMMDRIDQLGPAPHPRRRNRSSTRRPQAVCSTSGWNCTPYRPRPASSKAATGDAPVLAVTVAPGGGSAMASKWLIHTGWGDGRPPRRTPPLPDTAISARPYSPRSLGPTEPPSCSAMSWAP